MGSLGRTRLLFLSLALALAGCASEAPTGGAGGKADDLDDLSDCDADAEYVSWLGDFKQAPEFRAVLGGEANDLEAVSALIEAKPCARTDAAYGPWLALFEVLWAERVDPEERQWEIEAQEGLVLDAVLLAAPQGSGGVGYRDWLELYDEALWRAILPVIEGNQVLEDSGFTSQVESDALERVASARGQTAARGAYALWVERYATRYLDRATDTLSPEGMSITGLEGGYLDRFAEVAPGWSDKSAYLQWFTLHDARFQRAIGTTGQEGAALGVDESAALARLTQVMPGAVGEDPYLVWLRVFADRLSAVVSSSGGTGEVGASHLTHLLSVRPCGDSEAIQESWGRIEEVKERVQPEVADLIEEARPEPCPE